MQKLVSISQHGSINSTTIVSINTSPDTRPGYAISVAMWEELSETFARIAHDDSVRAVILRGMNGVFSQGANFKEILDVALGDQNRHNNRGAHGLWRIINYANTAVENCPKPVICVIERYALGAACALAVACDFRIAAEDPRAVDDPRRATLIGVPAPNKGLTLGVNDTRRLVSVVGAGYAREILITGKMYSAREAQRMGLINYVVVPDELEQSVDSLLVTLLKNAPRAMKEAKANLATVVRNPSFAGIDETSLPIEWAGSEDLIEGITAFFERRDPRFTGN